MFDQGVVIVENGSRVVPTHSAERHLSLIKHRATCIRDRFAAPLLHLVKSSLEVRLLGLVLCLTALGLSLLLFMPGFLGRQVLLCNTLLDCRVLLPLKYRHDVLFLVVSEG